MRELERLKEEITRRNRELRGLRERKKQLETHITEFLQANNRPGVQYGNMLIRVVPRKKNRRRTRQQKQETGVAFLSQCGIQNAEAVYTRMQETMNGPPEESVVLRVNDMTKL